MNSEMTSAIWKLWRCHESIKAAASEDYSPNRPREVVQGQGSIPTSLDTNLKSLRVIHLAGGAGPGAPCNKIHAAFPQLKPVLPSWVHLSSALTHTSHFTLRHYTKVCVCVCVFREWKAGD